MATTCVVGLQWGDEGKGKIVDLLSESAHMVVRFQGGANAGHTVVVGGKKFVLHHVPSGILHKGKLCVIANGVVLDPDDFFKEVDSLAGNGIDVGGRLFISERTHLVMPYHKLFDALSERNLAGNLKIGTTQRGIGPCYADKVARKGIRAVDLLNPRSFKRLLEHLLDEKNKILRALYDHPPVKAGEIYDQYMTYAKRMKPMIVDAIALVNGAIDKGKDVLFEGAQGSMLDIDLGTYPFVTSSNSDACGLSAGAGVPPGKIGKVIGVAKAYCTRVGAGPFPTEMAPALAERVRAKGGEYGATTGRPRRCGWFDIVAARHAVRINGIKELVITKLDVLSGLDRLMVGRLYNLRGKRRSTLPPDVEALDRCKPVWMKAKGWMEDISDVRDFRKLPGAARSYLQKLETLLDIRITIVSVGSDRDASFIKR